jgi:hypothetical protein
MAELSALLPFEFVLNVIKNEMALLGYLYLPLKYIEILSFWFQTRQIEGS